MTDLKIGTRASPLAMVQAEMIAAMITDASEGQIRTELVPMTTTGDQIQDRSLVEAGGKGLFTKELDIALAEGRADVLVHSLKDVPVELPTGQTLITHPEREDPRDAFVSLAYARFEDLPEGARLGTSSVRRAAFARARRPDLQLVEFRGNVQTRLKKLKDGVADATFLAAAGLRRMGLSEHASDWISEDVMLPAVGQGILGLAVEPHRLSDDVLGVLTSLNHGPSALAAKVERAVLAELDGSCRTPIAAHLFPEADGQRVLKAAVCHPSGSPFFSDEVVIRADASVEDAVTLGRELGQRLRKEGYAALPHLGDRRV